AAVVVALARPTAIVRGVEGGDLILVLDLSLSMRARDVAPTRFDRARDEALDLISHLRPGQRAGIVAAGPRPQAILPLAGDHGALVAAVRARHTGDTPGAARGGPGLGDGVSAYRRRAGGRAPAGGLPGRRPRGVPGPHHHPRRGTGGRCRLRGARPCPAARGPPGGRRQSVSRASPARP